MKSVSSAYLTGWEYNRLLQPDPIVRRNSALPGEVLWTGAAPFWLFETVYCTADSLRNETAAFESLGWPSGLVFTELANRGILVPLDWVQDLKPETKALIQLRHRQILSATSEQELRNRIIRRDSVRLEEMRALLIQPILESRNALAVVMPSSLKTWPQRQSESDTPAQGRAREAMVTTFLADVADPVTRTLDLLRRPGAGLPLEVRETQRNIQLEVEDPMITDLLAGEGEFAGDEGYLPYFEALLPHRDAYSPINSQLEADWKRNRSRLYRLRDAAEKHLWPQLHGEWIPRILEGDKEFAAKFPARVSAALGIGPLVEYLSKPASYVVAAAAGGAIGGGGIGAALAGIAALPDDQAGVVLAGAASGVAALAALAAKQAEPYVNLALFYQKARS